MRRRYKPGTAPIPDHCGATRKARFATRTAAERSLRVVQEKRAKRIDHQQHEQRVYRCPLCDGWHLTKAAA